MHAHEGVATCCFFFPTKKHTRLKYEGRDNNPHSIQKVSISVSDQLGMGPSQSQPLLGGPPLFQSPTPALIAVLHIY